MTRVTQALEHGKAAKAEEPTALTSNFKSYEDELQSHIDRGLDFYKKGSLHEAYVEFLEVLAINQNDALGHYLCGLTLQALKLEDMAVAEWAAASSLYVRDGAKWDSDWDWIKQKCYQLLEQHRDGRTVA